MSSKKSKKNIIISDDEVPYKISDKKIDNKKDNNKDKIIRNLDNDEDNLTKKKMITNDLLIDPYSLSIGGNMLINSSTLLIVNNSTYGLVGENGSGKSSLITDIEKKYIQQDKQTVYLVSQSIDFSEEETVLERVRRSNRRVNELVNKKKELIEFFDVYSIDYQNISEENEEKYKEEYDNYVEISYELENLNTDYKISKILYGLGFLKGEENKKVKDFSGGWIMRVSLACALYMDPHVLLLDEPTNHLDLNAVIWLTNYLTTNFKKTLVVVSHSRSFLDDVCGNIIHINNQKLKYYKGDYSQFLKQYEINIKQEENLYDVYSKKLKELKKKNDIKKTEQFIRSSEVKRPILKKIPKIIFPNIPEFHGNVINVENVSFSYDKNNYILENINLGINLESRVTLVGLNGSGKSTLLKILAGELEPSSGTIEKNKKLKYGYFNQHSSDVLPQEVTPIEYLMNKFNIKIEETHKWLSIMCILPQLRDKKMIILSHGQRSRVALIDVILQNPHVLFLDEPTNHLDIESIDALINGINEYNGGLVMITHDADMINKTNCVIYEVCDKHITETTYDDYVNKILESY